MFDVLARIREYLNARHITEYRLSKMTGIPQSTISTWFAKGINPPVDKIELICNSLGISMGDFFTLVEDRDGNHTSLDITAHAKWMLLNDKQKRAVLAMMEAMLDL